MDFSYIIPRNVKQLHDGLLMQAIVEYRQAAEILSRNETERGKKLHAQLMRAVAALEEEYQRRGFAGKAPAGETDVASYVS